MQVSLIFVLLALFVIVTGITLFGIHFSKSRTLTTGKIVDKKMDKFTTITYYYLFIYCPTIGKAVKYEAVKELYDKLNIDETVTITILK